MSKIQIIKPSPDELIPAPKVEYVDVNHYMDNALKLIWPDTSNDVPSSNVLFNSAHGMGKTLLVANLAVKLAEHVGVPVPLVVYDCSEDTRDHHLRGSYSIMPDGSTAFVLGPFPLAIELANEVGACVLCAEEISALTPGAQKQFNCMTDWREGIFLPQLGRNFNLKKNARVIVIGTMNPSAYGGVYTLNADLRSRFDEFVLAYPKKEEEEKILRKVCSFAKPDVIDHACTLARDSRTDATDYKLSTRDLVKLLQNFEKMGEKNIPLTLIANKFEEQERSTIVDRIKASFGVRIT